MLGEQRQRAVGDGTTTNSPVPIDVVGLSSGVKAIGADDNLSCALMKSGGVKCWGDDYDGSSYHTPTDMSGLTANIQAFTVAWGHLCVLTDVGGVKCRGSNSFGQLGDGTTTDSFTPVDVVGLGSGVSAITGGYYSTCALMASGGVKCWGPTPTDMVGLSSGVKSIDLGYSHACAIMTTGALKCWGGNTYGQLGDGTTTTSSVPVDVVGYSSSGAGVTLGYPIIVTDTLPSGLTYSSGGNSEWSCSAVGQVVTCESIAILNAGASSSFPIVVNPTTTGAKANTASVIGGGDTSAANSNTVNTTVNAAPTAISLTSLRVLLGGAYDSTSGLMRDDLRTLNLLPTSSPYASAAATANASVFAVSGNNAIVDWVLVELRNSATPATVVASQAALLQRDGDVVGLDGTSPLTIAVSAGNYYVAVKQRNHLGVMSAGPLSLATSSPVIDFTLPATAVYGTNARRTLGSVSTLWAGNANGDTSIIGAGPNNDNNAVLATVLTAPNNTMHLNNYVVNGYDQRDVNLDGKVIAAGPNNDLNVILYTIFVHPGNSTVSANYVVLQQLP